LLSANERAAAITSQRLSMQDWKVSMKQLARSGPSVGWKKGWSRISLQKCESHYCDSGAAMLKAGSRTSPGWKDEKWIPVRIRGTELEHTSVRVVALVESSTYYTFKTGSLFPSLLLGMKHHKTV
jgi:hypothetical protein